MISFENINKPDWKYELLHHYVNIVHNYVFYHHYYVLHKERLLKDQPLVVICNHQNGLSDALGILFALRGDSRRPVFIARADIFKREIAAKLLRFLQDRRIPADSWDSKAAARKLREALAKDYPQTADLIKTVMNYQVFLNVDAIRSARLDASKDNTHV